MIVTWMDKKKYREDFAFNVSLAVRFVPFMEVQYFSNEKLNLSIEYMPIVAVTGNIFQTDEMFWESP